MDRPLQLFDRLDSWRHLPTYQLERRADIFFSLYLREALERKLGIEIHPQLIPEFPVHVPTIYRHETRNRSFKIDYLALSKALDHAAFVELKTETLSRRDEQDRYLIAARSVGLSALLEGLLTIFGATSAKRKYLHLLDLLAQVGLLQIPARVYEIAQGQSLQGITRASEGIVVTCPIQACSVIYLQPHGSGPDVLSFAEFREVVLGHDDPLSQRFAQSLQEWAGLEVGAAPPGSCDTRLGA
jgi:hypothetical protein